MVQQILRSMIGATDDDSASDVQIKIDQLVCSTSTADVDAKIRSLELLLAVERGDRAGAVGGEDLRRFLFDSLRAFFSDWTIDRPSILVFDDLHWGDEATCDLVVHLASLARERPILLVAAFRPDRSAPSWKLASTSDGEHDYSRLQIELAPLGARDGQRLLDRLVGDSPLTPEIAQFIRERTDGNPFFIEEAVRAFVATPRTGESDTSPIGIPANLRGLLQARIDRLDDGARRALQHAAVVGRTFDREMLQELMRLSSSDATGLQRQIDRLVDEMLVQPASGEAAEYAFRHALIQDAAYKSLLRKRRRELHRRVAEILEVRQADRIGDFTTLLASHFYRAADRRSIAYDVRAGDDARRLYANSDAITHYNRAVEVIRASEKLRAGEPAVEGKVLLHLYENLGRALELTGKPADAIASYRLMRDEARALGDARHEMEALMAEATVVSTPNPAFSPEQGQKLSEQALALVREIGDQVTEARVLWNLLLLNTYTFHPHRAIEYGEQSLALARALGVDEQRAFTLHDLHRPYSFIGKVDRAREALDEAEKLWRASDNKHMLVDNLGSRADLCYRSGDYDGALQAFEEGDRIGAAIDNSWGRGFCRMIVGNIYFDRGHPGDAIAIMEEALEFGDRSGQPGTQIGTRSELAWVLGSLGAIDRGITVARDAIKHSAEARLHTLRPWPLGVLARLLLLHSDRDGAADALQRGRSDFQFECSVLAPVQFLLAAGELALARGDGAGAVENADRLLGYRRDFQMKPYAADALLLKGAGLLALDRAGAAREALRAALAETTGNDSVWNRWKIDLALSRIELRIGNATAAEHLIEEAWAIVRSIADRIGNDELRAAFLSTDDVGALRDVGALNEMP
jgi:tetratricopeptide (TPR) repeat protein